MPGHNDPHAPKSERTKWGFFIHPLLSFVTAWLFLTRIPLPHGNTEPAVPNGGEDKGHGMTPLADTVQTWPIVGLFIGVLAGGTLWIGTKLGLPPLAAGFLGLGVGVLATGGLHEDGLADVADGFGGGHTKADKMRIMRDSNIGTYAMLALVMTVGFKAASLSGFKDPLLAATALIAAHALSRAVLPLMMVVMPPARSSGLGAGVGKPRRTDALISAAIGVLVALLAVGPGPVLVAATLAAVGAAGMGWLAMRQIDGFTGDVLGATQQVVEVLVIAALAAGPWSL